MRYPQIEQWADALVACATQLPGCLVWPIGAPAERIAGLATARSHGHVEIGLWNAPVLGRTILLFAVAGVSPLSFSVTAEHVRRRGAANVHGCGIAIEGEATAEGLNSFRPLDPTPTQGLSAAA